MKNNYVVKEISKEEALEMVKKYHYSNTLPKLNRHYIGFYINDKLVGIVTLGWGTRPLHTIKKIFPSLETKDYYEIGRMCMTEEMPRNSESQMISKLIKWIKQNEPQIKVLFTWADGVMGKPGYVYQSCSFLYGGYALTDIYLKDGIKIHPRQTRALFIKNKNDTRKTIRPTLEQMNELNISHIRGKQFKYLTFLCDRKIKKKLLKECLIKLDKNYPKQSDLMWEIQIGKGKWKKCDKPYYKTDYNTNSMNDNQIEDINKRIKKIDEVEFYLFDLKSKFKKINSKEYYLSYSGGKDSHFLYWFIKEYLHDTDIEIVGVNTYMEHHEILQRILKNCDRVLLPKMKPMQIKEKYGIPCFSKLQDEIISRYQNGSRTKNTMAGVTGEGRVMFKLNNTAKTLLLSGKLHKISNKCCKVIKKDTIKAYEKESGRKAIMGVRGSESITRKSQYTTCFTKDKKFTPIHDLSDELLEKIIHKYNIEVPEVYKHINRTGCMGCPYGHKNTEKELALINENQKKFVCEYFKESYEVLGVNSTMYKQLTIDEYIK